MPTLQTISENRILHIEFQTDPKEDIPFRMLDYRLRLYRRFPHQSVYQVVIYLRKTNSELAQQTTFNLPELNYRYNVIRLWEVPTEQLMGKSGLLPFAVLSQTENRLDVLTQVAQRIESIRDVKEQNNVGATTAILAGLVLDKIIIDQILKEEIMKESVMYQEIQARGERKLILRLLNRKIGVVSQSLTEKIQGLSVEQLDDLGEALLDFESEQDLQQWLSLLNHNSDVNENG